MRFLGIDYGTKNIGLALSDELGRLAYPYRVLRTTARAGMTVAGICEQEGVEQIVIGDSRTYKGVENPLATAIHEFKATLEQLTSLPVNLEPEVLTTAQAKREIGLDKETDARAAALILRTYLDRNNK